jgi:hypothetical protein
MDAKRAEARGILGALALLMLVSLYRQLSLRLLPADPARPYVVYAVYLVLIGGWSFSIRSRFTQRNMRAFIFCQAAVMLLWLTIRFVQDAFVFRDIYLVRILGYFICIPAVVIPLLGVYAALGLGRGDDYRFSRKLYLLLLPAAALAAAALTNESHHLIYRAIAGEPEPNLYFHPNYGIFIIYGWGLALIAARVVIIYRRNRPGKSKSLLQRLAPYLEPAFLLAFCAPYTVSSFWVHRELIEFSAGVFFLEAVSWELFIWLGMIPVNTQYKTVFDLSTVGMQVVTDEGVPVVSSRTAPALTAETFEKLLRANTVSAEDGTELQAYRLQSGYLVWQRDVSQLRSVISQLRKSEAELRQESGLLSQELRLKSEEAAVAEQNRIYNQLTIEVGPQLRMLEQLLKKQETVPDRAALFREICLIGTYVKRRCSLRLIEQSDGAIPSGDLALSFRELTARLADMGAETSLSWSADELPSSAFALLGLDIFEFLLEHEHFALAAARVDFLPGACLSVFICPSVFRGDQAPEEGLRRMCAEEFELCCKNCRDGYAVTLRQREKTPC